jgi:hypothetical protein
MAQPEQVCAIGKLSVIDIFGAPGEGSPIKTGESDAKGASWSLSPGGAENAAAL